MTYQIPKFNFVAVHWKTRMLGNHPDRSGFTLYMQPFGDIIEIDSKGKKSKIKKQKKK